MNGPGAEIQRCPSSGFSSSMMMTVVLLAIAMIGMAWVYMGMVTRDRWPIQWLEVDGTFQRVSAERVRIQLEPLVKGSFFTVELPLIRAQVESLPWVALAAVQKNWPDTVRVSIREYIPVAHWAQDNLVSSTGSAFTVPGAAEIQGLPWLDGPEERLDRVFGHWQKFNEELYPIGLEIERIRLDPRGSWYLALTNGTEVHIGREDALGRLHRLAASWPELMKLKDMAPMDVDLRYSNGFSVRWPDPPPQMAANPG